MTDPKTSDYKYKTLDPSPSFDIEEYSDLYDDYLDSPNDHSMESSNSGGVETTNQFNVLPPTLNATQFESYSDDSLDSSFADMTLKTPQLSMKSPIGTPRSPDAGQFMRSPVTPAIQQKQNTHIFPSPKQKRNTSNESHASRVPTLLGITTGLKYYKKIRKSIGNASSPHTSKHHEQQSHPESPKSPVHHSIEESPKSNIESKTKTTEIPPIPAPINFNENITDEEISESESQRLDNFKLNSSTLESDIKHAGHAQDNIFGDSAPDSVDAEMVDAVSQTSDLSDAGLSDSDDDLDEDEAEALMIQSQNHKQGLYQGYQTPEITQRSTNDAMIITNIEGQPPQIIRKGIQDFKIGKELGEGSYSTVVLGTDIETGYNYAIKILNKRHIIKEKKVKYVNIEKNALNRLGERNGIIGLHYTFQDAASLYFVLDFAENGELLTLIKRHGTLNETSARHYSIQLIDAIDYMHTNGIVHRDLKPENILIDKDMRLQVTDFGTAKILDADENGHYPADTRANSFVGTAEYVSPELLNDKFCGKAADIWSLGCIIFQMVAGKPPFKANNEYLTFQKIQKLQYAFTAGFPIIIRDVIKRMLVLKPRERLTIKDIQKHLWFKDIDWNDANQIWNTIPPELGPYKISAKSMKPMPELDLQYPNGSSTSIQRTKSGNVLTGSRKNTAKQINMRSASSGSTQTTGVKVIQKKAQPQTQVKRSTTNTAAAVALYGTNIGKASSPSTTPPASKPVMKSSQSSPNVSTQDHQATADIILKARMNQQKEARHMQLKERERRMKAQKQKELKMKQQAQLKQSKEKEDHDRLVREQVIIDLKAKEMENQLIAQKEVERKQRIDQELIALQKERSNQHSQSESRGSVEVIPGTNIPRPVVNIRIPSSRTTSGVKSRNNSSFKIKRDREVPPMSAIDLKCADFLEHADERVLKVGAVEECREFTNVFEKKYKGMAIESPLGYKNKDTINLSLIIPDDDVNPTKLCDVQLEAEPEKKDTDSGSSDPPTSAQKFKNFFTVKQVATPILDAKYASRRLLITSFGRALVLKEIISKDKVKYQLTTEIDLTNSSVNFVEVVGERKSRNIMTGMFAITSDTYSICFEVEKAEVTHWTQCLATSRILEKERRLNEYLISVNETLPAHEESNAFTAATLATQKGTDSTPASNIKVRKPPPPIPTQRASSPTSSSNNVFSHGKKKSIGAGPMISAAINKAVSLATVNAAVGVKPEEKKITAQNSKFLARSRFH